MKVQEASGKKHEVHHIQILSSGGVRLWVKTPDGPRAMILARLNSESRRAVLDAAAPTNP